MTGCLRLRGHVGSVESRASPVIGTGDAGSGGPRQLRDSSRRPTTPTDSAATSITATSTRGRPSACTRLRPLARARSSADRLPDLAERAPDALHAVLAAIVAARAGTEGAARRLAPVAASAMHAARLAASSNVKPVSPWRTSRERLAAGDTATTASHAIASSSVSGGSTATGGRERQDDEVGGREHLGLAGVREILEVDVHRRDADPGAALARCPLAKSRLYSCVRTGAKTSRRRPGVRGAACVERADDHLGRESAAARPCPCRRRRTALRRDAERGARGRADPRGLNVSSASGGGTTCSFRSSTPCSARASRTDGEARGVGVDPAGRRAARPRPRATGRSAWRRRAPPCVTCTTTRGPRARSAGASASGSPTRWATPTPAAGGRAPAARGDAGKREPVGRGP